MKKLILSLIAALGIATGAQASGGEGLAWDKAPNNLNDLPSLQRGPYPDSLKHRVASKFGHLNNSQTNDLLSRLDRARIQWVVGLHLSEQNNSPEHVRAAIGPALEGARFPLHLATQDAATEWFALD